MDPLLHVHIARLGFKKESLHLLWLLAFAGDLYRAQKTERKASKQRRNTGVSVNELNLPKKTPRQLQLRHTERAALGKVREGRNSGAVWPDREVQRRRDATRSCYRALCKESIVQIYRPCGIYGAGGHAR